jgi:hypothetical protein
MPKTMRTDRAEGGVDEVVQLVADDGQVAARTMALTGVTSRYLAGSDRDGPR